MSLTLSAIVTAAIVVAVSQVGAVIVYTPLSVVACSPVQLSWANGQAPYYLSLLPGGQPDAAPLQDLGEQSGNSLSWKPTFPAGTEITIQIRDNAGVINYSGLVTIKPGTETCAPTSDHHQTPANTPAHAKGALPITNQTAIHHPSNATPTSGHVQTPANTSAHAKGTLPITNQTAIHPPPNATPAANNTGILGPNSVSGTTGLNSTGLLNSTTLSGLNSTGLLGGLNSTSTGITSTASPFTTPTTSNTKSVYDDSDEDDLDSGASRTSVSITAVLVAGVVTFLL